MSVLGSPIQDYVKRQIAKRQKIHGSGVSQTVGSENRRSLDEISYLNSKSAWCKLASSVYVNDDSNGKKRLTDMGQPDTNVGTKLAKEYVLFNGLGKKGNRAGIGGSTGAYGVGGVDQGYVPMPGIKDFNIECLSRGSLKKVSLSIICFNSAQLSVIDALYCRLGFTVFLEWGWDKYFKNGEDTITSNESSLIDKFLGTNTKKAKPTDTVFKSAEDELRYQIFSQRAKTHGNYDAIVARIVNFNWTFTPEGNYEVKIELLSKGDIMDSLIINQPPAIKSDFLDLIGEVFNIGIDTSSVGALISSIFSSGTRAAKIITALITLPFRSQAESANRFQTHYNELITFLAEFKNQPTWDQDAQVIVVGAVQTHRTTTRKQNKDSAINFNTSKLYRMGHAFFGDFPTRPTSDFVKYANTNKFSYIPKSWSTGGYPTDYVNIERGGNGLYMRLGAFLEFVETVCVPKTDGGVPLLRIWHKASDNLFAGIAGSRIRNPIYSMGDTQISLDPRVCIIANYNFATGDPSAQNHQVFGGFNFPTNKPSYCGLEQFHRTKYGVQIGELMNVYLSCEYIANTLFGGVDFKGEIFLGKMLEDMCNDVSTALGGVNKLEVTIDEEINTIQIIDQAVIPGKEEIFKKKKWFEPAILSSGYDEDYIRQSNDETLGLFGYSSFKTKTSTTPPGTVTTITSNFVRNIGLETGITPEYATMITIGATAGGYSPGVESSAFSKWNEGLTDRFKNVVYDAQLETEPTTISKFEDIYKEQVNEYDNFLMSGWKIMGIAEDLDEDGNFTLDDGVIDSNVGHVTDYYQYIHASSSQDDGKASNQTGFMPFNVTIDMDGLSGFKIFQKLNVGIDFLPRNYPKSMDFIITKVNSTLSDNDWVTSLETMCIAKSAATQVPSIAVVAGGGGGGSIGGVTERTGTGSPTAFELSTDKVRMKLMRILDDGRQTLGVLQVYAADGVTKLYELKTCELPYRGNNNNISAIPTGKYLMRAAYTSTSPHPPGVGAGPYFHYFRLVGNETNLPNPYEKLTGGGFTRTGVLMHRGQFSEDIAGCILPGTAFSTNISPHLKAGGVNQGGPLFSPQGIAGNMAGNPHGIKGWTDSVNTTQTQLANTFYVDGDNAVARDTSFFLEIYNKPGGLLTGEGHGKAELDAYHII